MPLVQLRDLSPQPDDNEPPDQFARPAKRSRPSEASGERSARPPDPDDIICVD